MPRPSKQSRVLLEMSRVLPKQSCVLRPRLSKRPRVMREQLFRSRTALKRVRRVWGYNPV